MSDLHTLIDTPIGGLFFVSGAISVLILLAIFIAKKGTELHSLLGYIFMFGLSFANYSAALAFYDGLLPLAAVVFTIPISTLSMIAGLTSIMPELKSVIRIRIHVICMITATMSVLIGTVINWYHFNISALKVFNWSDVSVILTMCLPVLLFGVWLTVRFLSRAKSYVKKQQVEKEKMPTLEKDKSLEGLKANVRANLILRQVDQKEKDGIRTRLSKD